MARPDPAVPRPSTPEASPTAAALIPLGSHAKAAPIELKRPATLIGSRKEIVRLHLQSSTVSKAHCVVVLNHWGCYVHDLASRTGVLVNDNLVVDADLADGDVLQVGRFRFQYRAPRPVHGTPLPAGAADVSVSTLAGPVTVTKRVLTIGRRPGCDLLFEDSRVGNVHAIVFEHNGRRFVRDLSSRTGTWLGAKPVHQEPLPDVAPLRVGGTVLSFVTRPAELTTDDLTTADLSTADRPLADDPAAGVAAAGRPAADAPLTLAAAAAAAAVLAEAPPDLGGPAVSEPADDDTGIDGPDLVAPDLVALDLVAPDLDPLDLETAEADTPEIDAFGTDAPETDTPKAGVSASGAADAGGAASGAAAPDAGVAPPAGRTPAADLEPDGDDTADNTAADVDDDTDAADGLASLRRDWLASPRPPVAPTPPARPTPPETTPAATPAREPAREPAARATPPAPVPPAPPAPVAPPAARPPAAPPPAAPPPAPSPDAVVPGPAAPGAASNAGHAEAEADLDADVDVDVDEAVEAVQADEAAAALLELDDAQTAGPLVVGAAPEVPAVAADAGPVAPAAEAGVDAAFEPAVDAGVDAVVADPLDDLPGLVADADATDDALFVPTDTPADGRTDTPADTTVAAAVDAPIDAPVDGLSDASIDATLADLIAVGLIADPDAPAADADAPAAEAADAGLRAGDPQASGDSEEDALVLDPAADAGLPAGDPLGLGLVGGGLVDFGDLRLETADEDLAGDDDVAADAAAARADVIARSPAPAPSDQAGPDALGHDATPADAAAADAGPAPATPVLRSVAMPSLADDDLEAGVDTVADIDADAGIDLGADLRGDLGADPDAAADAFARRPGQTPVEPDLVRLDLDDDDEANEATALAVDLGLVLDDETDAPEVTAAPAAGPASPVEIDLATAPPARDPAAAGYGTPGAAGYGPDLPLTGAIGQAVPAAPVDDGTDDLFEADILDEGAPPDGLSDADFRLPPPAGVPARPAAGAPTAADGSADDFGDAGEIAPPAGGSLADLMPSGPPLLGGSFMSLPPMPTHTPPEPPAGAGGKRRPLRVGFGGAQRPQRSSPFASDRTVADAMGPAAGSVDTFASPSPAVPIPSSPATNGAGRASGGGPGASSSAFDDDLDDFDAPGGTAARVGDAGGSDFDDLDAAADGRPPAATPDAEQRELLSTADRFRPRGVIRPDLTAAGAAPLATPFADVPIRIPESGTGTDDGSDERAGSGNEQARRHRGRVNRVVGCLIGMLVLGGGAAGAIYGFVPQKSTLDALITYDGLDRLGTAEAETVRVRQNDAVLNETVRQRAVQGLPPQMKDAGFLSDLTRVHDAVAADPKVRWPADRPTVMRLRVSSADKQNDVARLHALAQAVVDSAADDRRKKEDLHGRLLVDYGQLEQLNRQRSDIDDQLQALQQATANRPDPARINALQADYLAAEPVLTGVKGRRMELEGRIDMLKRAIAAPTTASAAAAVDPAAADDEIAKLTAQLAALQQGGDAAKQQAAEASAAARKSLDDSIARFQQDLTAAQKLRDNPVLGSYVDAANRIFKETREFTESFIRSQENLRTRVSELTSSLSDKMAARAQKLIETDPELKKLNDRLAIGTRQYNAATAEGFGDEAKKSELELRLLKVKIAEREDQYKNDPVDAEAITQLQNLKETLQTQIRDNRKYADERLTAAQDEFVKNTPAVAQLPAEQKSLAEGIEAKLTAVNDARRAYDAASEKAQADQAKADAAAADKGAALRLQIAARRQDVLAAAAARAAENDDAARRRRLESAQAELADVRTQEQTAQHRLADATAAIETAEKARRATAQSDADREAKLADRDTVDRKRQDTQASITARQAELARRIVPDDRTVEFHDYDEPDRRPLLAGASFGGVFLLLGIPAVANLLALAREAHPHGPPPTPPARPTSPGEGFEPVLLPDPRERKALPQPASV